QRPDQLMRPAVAGKIGAVHQDAVLAAAALVAHGVEERRYAVTSETMVPGDEPARRVEAGAQEVPGERPEASVVDVILARPVHLHGPSGRLRQEHRVDNEIGVARSAASEAAAHQHVVELDLLARDAERLGGAFLRHGLALGAAPDFGGIA